MKFLNKHSLKLKLFLPIFAVSIIGAFSEIIINFSFLNKFSNITEEELSQVVYSNIYIHLAFVIFTFYLLNYLVIFPLSSLLKAVENKTLNQLPDNTRDEIGILTNNLIKIQEKELARYQEKIEMSKRFEVAQKARKIGVWEWDVKNNVLIWDKLMYQIYGVKEEDFSGAYEAWEKTVHPDDVSAASQALNDALEGKREFKDVVFRIIWPNKEIRYIDAHADVLRDEKGNAIKAIGINSDITRRIKMLEELNLAKEKAMEASIAKGNFLANMSHEIRTPMNAIMGMIQLTLQTELNPEQEDMLRSANGASVTLLNIINDVLDFSKIESGNFSINPVNFELSSLLNKINNLLSLKAKEKNVSLSIKDNHDKQIQLYGDDLRLEQILINLINNAIKFTPENGKVDIAVDSSIINNKVKLIFSVHDTGIGIPKNKLKSIFNPFVQADETTTRKFGGTGLGLSICKKLITLMGGEIGVESTVNKGTTFFFNLTFDMKTEVNPKKEETKIITADIPFSELNILLAEDNLLNQKVVIKILNKLGANVVVANNGLEALQILKENEDKKFNLILMDCQMPEMGGIEATGIIRKHNSEYYKNIPIIALTANTMTGDREKCLESGMNDYLPKPVDFKKLEEALAKWGKNQ